MIRGWNFQSRPLIFRKRGKGYEIELVAIVSYASINTTFFIIVTILATIPVHVPPGGGKDQNLSEAFWKEARALTAPNRYSSGHLICIRSWMTLTYIYTDSSVQFSCSVVSDSLRPHELQHSRPPCPSPTPRVYLNSWPLSR